MGLFQLYQLVDYKVFSLLTNLAFEFSILYCSSKNCTLVSSLLHSSHVSRSAEGSSIAKGYLIVWVKHSQACNKMVEKKKLNGIKIYLTSHSPCIKKIACQKSKELGCEFPWYQYSQAITHLFIENNDLFCYSGDPAWKSKWKKSMGKKRLFIIPCNQNVKI